MCRRSGMTEEEKVKMDWPRRRTVGGKHGIIMEETWGVPSKDFTNKRKNVRPVGNKILQDAVIF